MDHLWTPWRYRYVTSADAAPACIFCAEPAENQDEKHFIVHRGRLNFVMLNLYPYTSGHMMVAPYEHVGTLAELPEETAVELFLLSRRAEGYLRTLYQPNGINIGMNIGSAAGAGVAGHLHIHVLPRWFGDTSFMTTVSETRVLPEDLTITFEKLRQAFARQA